MDTLAHTFSCCVAALWSAQEELDCNGAWADAWDIQNDLNINGTRFTPYENAQIWAESLVFVDSN